MKFPWQRERKQQELEQELQFHLQMAASDRMDRGESARDAEYSARREFGNVALVTSMIYGVSSADPITFFTVAFLLVLVALAACYIPARRAMRVDPIIALRYE